MAVESGGATMVKLWWSTTSGVSTAGESPNFGNFIKSPEINMKVQNLPTEGKPVVKIRDVDWKRLADNET
nr:hypothetical protein Iba_chr09aCG7080 [Ipomoea batatas]